MNEIMKKITIIASLIMGLLLTASCESDRDSNPVYQQPTKFQLNTPALVNNLYDLENASLLTFTTSQPDYGYTAPVNYSIQMALSADGFASEDTYKELATVFNTAKMDVNANEFSVALSNLLNKAEDEYPIETAVFIRAKAVLAGAANAEQSTIYSNVVELPHVLAYYALPPVEMPTKMYMIGSMVGWDWAKAYEMVPVHSNPDLFWRMVYVPEGGQFKFNSAPAWDGDQYGTSATLKDNAGSGISGAADSDNIQITKGGWYLIIVKSEVAGAKLAHTVYVESPKVYLFGHTASGIWSFDDANLFSVPADGDGYFVSNPFSEDSNSDAGVRVCVNLNNTEISGVDWWKSEFIILDGKLEYRGTGNDQARAQGKAGQRIYINFTNGTGKIE